MDDFEHVIDWSKDEAFCNANGWRYNTSREDLYKWWFSHVHSLSEKQIRLAIQYGGTCIGYCDLAHIENHTAELGIEIGESQHWGKGIGSLAAKSLMGYGTRKFGITTYYAEIDDSNHRSQNMLKTLGFEEMSRIEHNNTDNTAQFIQYKLNLK